MCGISLDESKKYLVEARLSGLIAETNSRSYSELYAKARSDGSNILSRKIVDAMTTKETLFFQGHGAFRAAAAQDYSGPHRQEKRLRSQFLPVSIRIWSAACSTGQEVYSVAMVLKRTPGRYVQSTESVLLGTDISDSAVAAASRGFYSNIEIERGLPPEKLMRYLRSM